MRRSLQKQEVESEGLHVPLSVVPCHIGTNIARKLYVGPLPTTEGRKNSAPEA